MAVHEATFLRLPDDFEPLKNKIISILKLYVGTFGTVAFSAVASCTSGLFIDIWLRKPAS